MRPLAGITVVELAGIGPAPFCGMLLADLGADVVLIERPDFAQPRDDEAPQVGAGHAIFHRGKRSVALDLKQPSGRDAVLALVRRADGVIEGMRPGAAERLGVGPDICRAGNPRLVYGRVTGWGQTGPLATAAGHDLNYLALAGALWYAGAPGEAPVPPTTLLGDVAGGALYLALGMLAALLRARMTGQGAVIDAAIVDGSANMMNLLLSRMASGHLHASRGTSLMDGPHWSGVYRCADGRWISLQPLEPRFYRQLLDKLGLGDDPGFQPQYDPAAWGRQRARMAELFGRRESAHWRALLENSDTCFGVVLSPAEAAEHPHLSSRRVYLKHHGVLQAAAAPRFIGEAEWQPPPIPRRGEHTAEILAGLTAC